MRAERSQRDEVGGGVPRPRSQPPRSRSADRAGYDERSPEQPADPRAPRPQRSAAGERQRPARRAAPPQRGIRGALGVLGAFLVTLAGAAVDSYVGVGLGIITTVALVGSVVVAALLVRRRDLGTLVVAPPLLFVGVAVVNIVLAPSATLSLPTIATLLIRGFPAMAIAVAAALVITVVRLVARR